MKYTIISTILFISQFKELHGKTRKNLKEKIELLKENPFRNKSLVSYKNFFRIRFIDLNLEKRLIYSVKKDAVKLLFILDRKNDYKDLRKYLKKIKE